jgi:hypothetical protein
MHNPMFPAFGPLSDAAKTPLGPHHANVIIITLTPCRIELHLWIPRKALKSQSEE